MFTFLYPKSESKFKSSSLLGIASIITATLLMSLALIAGSGLAAHQSADSGKNDRPKRKKTLVPKGRNKPAYRTSNKDT
jgi:hypothetical protein